MSDENNYAAVRVCAISDIQCSHGCGTDECKREREARYPVEQPAGAPIDNLNSFDEQAALRRALDARGDDEGQGLGSYWKDAFRTGWMARAALSRREVATKVPATYKWRDTGALESGDA
ncbi:hypothetical protein ACV22V_08175 [Burkholderia sp. AW33-5]